MGGLKKRVTVSLLKKIEGRFCIQYKFFDHEYRDSIPLYMLNKGLRTPLHELHAINSLVPINFENFSAKFTVTALEKKATLRKYGIYGEKFSIVSPESKASYTPVKGWSWDKFKKLVEKRYDIKWVQVGVTGPCLSDVVHCLTGKTTLRELIVLVSAAEFVVATEGMLNHIASAFEACKSIVIMSGFSPTEYIQHANTVIVERVPKASCAPCWLTTECRMQKKICTDDISVEDVEKALDNLLSDKLSRK